MALGLQHKRPRLVLNLKKIVARIPVFDVRWKIGHQVRIVCLARVHPDVCIAQDDASENLVFCPLALVIVQIITN